MADRVQAWIKEAGLDGACIKRGSPWEDDHVRSFATGLRVEFIDRELLFSLEGA